MPVPAPATVARPRVVVIDDDKLLLKAVTAALVKDGCDAVGVDDPVEGMDAAAENGVDVALVDIKMPNVSGLEVLRAIKAQRPEVEVIMMTGYGTVETAVEAMKAGAYHYLQKPFAHIEEVGILVKKAAEVRRLRGRARFLEEALNARDSFEGLHGQSARMQAVFRMIDSVAYSSATVLVQGESGTGKELVARAIHYRSPRKERPFVAVNCSALTETLLESELFGHVRGAFTGAVGAKRGLFETADGGTLFLDEIGDVTPAMQVRLLRVLQEGEVKRVGSTETLKVDVRVIAATNRDLQRAVHAGKFREDLFYRLNVIAIDLPPLRDRPEDIPLLAHHFLRKFGAKMGKAVKTITPEAVARLTTHRWVGNVRELENAVERAVVLCRGEEIHPEDLPPSLGSDISAPDVEVTSLAHLPYAEAKRLSMRSFERRYLSALMRRSGDNVTKAAEAAGMDRSNFRRLLKQYEVAGRSRDAAAGEEGRPEPADSTMS